MIIGEHYGPNGQIFFAEESPEGHENPAWFHTLAATLFPYHFERERRGWNAVVIYVTDYSLVEYDLEQHNDETFISTHTAAETFTRARDVRYVAGSDVLGGMGPDLIPFSDDDDIETFREEHGGDVVEYSDITPESIADYT
jgi:nitrous oxide reductase accessory protein NosL